MDGHAQVVGVDLAQVFPRGGDQGDIPLVALELGAVLHGSLGFLAGHAAQVDAVHIHALAIEVVVGGHRLAQRLVLLAAVAGTDGNGDHHRQHHCSDDRRNDQLAVGESAAAMAALCGGHGLGGLAVIRGVAAAPGPGLIAALPLLVLLGLHGIGLGPAAARGLLVALIIALLGRLIALLPAVLLRRQLPAWDALAGRGGPVLVAGRGHVALLRGGLGLLPALLLLRRLPGRLGDRLLRLHIGGSGPSRHGRGGAHGRLLLHPLLVGIIGVHEASPSFLYFIISFLPWPG